MVEVITESLEFNILSLHDRSIIGFSDKSNADSQDIFMKFEKAANNSKCKDIMFMKAELEDAEEVFKQHKIESLPAFLFFRNGNKTDEMFNNDPKLLQKKIIDLLK